MMQIVELCAREGGSGMGNLLRVAAALGGTAGMAFGALFFFLVPDVCNEMSNSFGPVGYNCFGLGTYSRLMWASGVGGIAALASALVTYVVKDVRRDE
jgi:hypothetical protein